MDKISMLNFLKGFIHGTKRMVEQGYDTNPAAFEKIEELIQHLLNVAEKEREAEEKLRKEQKEEHEKTEIACFDETS